MSPRPGWSSTVFKRIAFQFNEDDEEMGLALYDGKTIRIRGWLTPGDRLFVTQVTVVDDHCRPELQERTFIRD